MNPHLVICRGWNFWYASCCLSSKRKTYKLCEGSNSIPGIYSMISFVILLRSKNSEKQTHNILYSVSCYCWHNIMAVEFCRACRVRVPAARSSHATWRCGTHTPWWRNLVPRLRRNAHGIWRWERVGGFDGWRQGGWTRVGHASQQFWVVPLYALN